MRLSAPLSKLLAFEDDHEHRIALRMRTGKLATHRDVSFGELRDAAARFSGALRDAGATPGQRVALLMPHNERLISSLFGCLYGGFVPSIIAWPTAKMDAEKYRRNVTTVVSRLAAHHLVTDATSAAQLGEALQNTNVIAPGLDNQARPATASPRSGDALLIQFSGGTTGVQKSVPIGEAQLVAQLESYSARLALTERDAVISWLPLYHDMGLVACLLLPFAFRIPVSVFSPMEWVMDPRPFLEGVARDNATLCWLPNFAFSFMATRAKSSAASIDLSSLRAAINCSEPVRKESMDAFATTFAAAGLRNGVLQACYAMAETTFAVTQTQAGLPPRELALDADSLRSGRVSPDLAGTRILVSCGTPIEGAEVRIVNEKGTPSRADDVGEIEIRAPFVMTDYLDPQTGPRAAFRGDWYHTGDLGFMLDGELYVTGRKKDLIIIGGVNVFPEDVESCMSRLEGIRPGRTVAMGFADDHLHTERLVVVAEVTDPVLLEGKQSLERAVRAAIAAECGVAPSEVLLVPPQWIVKSTAGKISRSETKARILANRADSTSTAPASETR